MKIKGELIFNDATGEQYSVAHLRAFDTPFDMMIDGQLVPISLRVVFSDHCYTRGREEHDKDSDVVVCQEHRGGSVEERVFCRDRWDFSHNLPAIIRSLGDKHCLPGNKATSFYRLEDRNPKDTIQGRYLCLGLSHNNKFKSLVLDVKSAHMRTNQPHDIRGPQKRFNAILRAYYLDQKGKRDWL